MGLKHTIRSMVVRWISSHSSGRVGKVIFTLQRYLEPLAYHLKSPRVRVGMLAMVVVLIISEISTLLAPFFDQNAYALGAANQLLPEANDIMASKLSFDTKSQEFKFSNGHAATPGLAQSDSSAVSATAPEDPSKGLTVTDGTNKVDFTLTPKFSLQSGKRDANRVVYPLTNGSGWAVYTMSGIGVKEDVVLNYASADTMKLDYTLGLGNGMEARLQPNGSVGVYGNKLFSSNISVGSDKDAAILQKARQNAKKDTFLFSIPQPIIYEPSAKGNKKQPSVVQAHYVLNGTTLSIEVSNLKKGKYPIAIDPTIYVVTAQQFMAGNNETNIDFDVTDKLIRKASTTGARYNTWQSNTNLPNGSWGGGTVANGGYAYSVGGQASTSQTFSTQGSSTYTVPSGVTSITVKMWGGGGGSGGASNATGAGGAGGGGGYVTATLTVTPLETLNVYVGGGGGGGVLNSGGVGAGGGGGGGGYSSLYRSTTPLAIASGGGGGGGGRGSTSGGGGGPGGCTTTAASCNGASAGVGGGGGGATNSAGGSGGSGTNTATGGSSLTGGPGADGRSGQGADGGGVAGGLASGGAGGAPNVGGTTFSGGGGGAAGYFGGGGGGSASSNSNAAGGGGGGANYTDAGATGVTNTIGSGSTPGNSSDASRNGAGQAGLGAVSVNGTSGSNGIVVITYGSGSAPSTAVNWTNINTDGSIIGATSTTGVTKNSANYDSGNNNTLSCTLVKAGASGTVSTVHAHVGAVAGTMAVAIYSDNGSQTAPVTPLGNSPVTTLSNSNVWQTFILNNPVNVTSGSYYWLIENASSDTTQIDFQQTADGALAGTFSDVSVVPTGTWPTSPTMVGTTNAPTTGWAINMDITGTGGGTCSTWCTNSLYNLPSGRANYSLVAYNGFLYAMGGIDSTGTRQSTVYIAKFGANGEPRLWHPTDANKANWVYWYTDTGLSSIRASMAAVAYNNRMYVIGGVGASAPVSTVEIANINPNGTLGSWSTSTALSSAVYGHNAQVYNDRLYVIGGAATVGGAPVTTVQYNKINSDGTLNSWVSTTSLATARMQVGGTFTTIWGAYLYVSGGCGGVVGGGVDYCNSILSDTQVASINADGSLDNWNSLANVVDPRIGHSLLAWRNNIYEFGGCYSQNTSTGDCNNGMTSSIFNGTVNQDGDASTVGQSVASGTSPCSGGSPTGCNLPGTANIGDMLSAAIITNGYLYVIGGCTTNACSSSVSGNTAYVAISSTGTMSKPATCPSGGYQGGDWCVDNVHTISGGIAATSAVVFNNILYLVGGLNGSNVLDAINQTTLNSDGSIGAWTSNTLSGAGATAVSYDYAYARANPSSAGTNPGNLFIFGGCTTSSGGPGCSAYTDGVYKCNIGTSGTVASCSKTSQLQIGIIPGDTVAGLGAMSGIVYANYVYLVGGLSPNLTDLKTARYAKIDNNNNIVTVGSGWTQSSYQMSVGRRRAAGFGYNGYIYIVGGYDGTGGTPLGDIEFIKVNVSDGSLVGTAGNQFNVSIVTINQRWGLSVPVSNSYAYVIGGCTVGASPGSCTTRTDVIQTFQLYNNDSGAPAGYATSANTFGTNPNRIGVSSAILNGYLYTAGGCTGTADCVTPVTTVSYAAIDANGALGSWSDASAALPAARAWGKFLAAGGTLYYVGGQDTNGNAQTTVYYGTPSSGNVSSWSTASNGLPNARTRFGAAVWNNRLYVVGGGSGTSNSYVYATAGSSNTLTIPSGVSTVTIRTWGGGGAGGNGSGSTGTGGNGGGSGFAQADISVSNGDVLSINVGSGGSANSGTSTGGNGGGYSSVVRSGSTLIQAGGGGGGGGTNGSNSGAGGNGGPGGGANGGAGGAGTAAFFNGTPGGGGGNGTTSAGGTAGSAGSSGVAGNTGAANNAGDGGGSLTNCSTTVTGRGGNGGTGAGGKGGTVASCASGGGAGGGRFGGGGGGSASNGGTRGGGGGGGGSDLVTGSNTLEVIGSNQTPGQNSDTFHSGSAGQGGTGSTSTSGATSGSDGEVVITYGSFTPQSTVYVSPQLNSGGDIGSAWSTASTSFNVARLSPTALAYANNLYVFGGNDGTNYLSDSQYSQISTSTGNAGSWTYSESLPTPLAGGDGFAANGYIYLVGGRSAATTCNPVTLIAPVSANTTIASGNNPTGLGAWYVTNQRYTGSRYGNAAVYNDGKAYVLGGGCGSSLTYASPVTQQTPILSQPQVAKYSISFDTDTDVYPTNWLLNGVDNSIGAFWQLKYRSMTDPTASGPNGTGKNCSAAAMTTWGQETNVGNVTLMSPGTYTPLDGSGVNTNCARYYYINISVNSSQAFGYPDDVSRGPTITDFSLRFTADPSKRLMHGRTFINGTQMPDDTPYYAH